MRARVARFTAIFQAFFLMATLVLPALASAAEISTDLWIYQYGDTVTVTGVDFGADEDVTVVTTDPFGAGVDSGVAHTDATGGFTYAFVLLSDVPGIYDVAATGLGSGLSASTQFDPPTTTTTTTTLNLGSANVPYGTAVTFSGTLAWTATGLNGAQQTKDGRTITLRSYSNSTCTGSPATLGTATTSGDMTSRTGIVPWPRSAANATTLQPYSFFNHLRIMEVSRPPE